MSKVVQKKTLARKRKEDILSTILDILETPQGEKIHSTWLYK
jgi:phage baseplate assembly protein W